MSRRPLHRVFARFAVAAIEFLTLVAMAFGVAHAGEPDAQVVAIQAANPNLVANGGFEANLQGWSFVDPAATWDALDASADFASGSIELDEQEPFDELSVARQCVGVPAPGTYQLDAKGNGGSTARFQDFLEVRYAYVPAGSNCADFPSGYGLVTIPLGSGWKQPQSPALVEVGADTWTASAVIAIDLVIVRNQGEEFSGLSGRFDDVSLTLRGDAVFKDEFEGSPVQTSTSPSR